jgi:hypothetical protein
MTRSIKTIVRSPYFFWVAPALPSLFVLAGIASGRPLIGLQQPAAAVVGGFILISLMIAPLQILSCGNAWPNWLVRRHRAIGRRNFGNAALHALFYLADLGSFAAVMIDALQLGIWAAAWTS